MALLFVDSFDHYASADLLKKWSSGTATISTTLGRRSGGALVLFSSYATLNLNAALSGIICGMAVKWAGDPTDQELIRFLDNTTANVSLYLRNDGSIRIIRKESTPVVLYTSLPGVAPISGWFYLEVKMVFHESTGAFEVRVNGNTVISQTNADTVVSGAGAYATSLRLGTSTAMTIYVDDFYVCDTSGTVNNDFLGDCRVDAYLPTSDGALSAWTPEPAGVHYTTVDEATPNTTDYVSSATVGNKELFGVPDMINTPLSIFGVQLAAAAWKTDAGFREIKGLVRISGTDYPSSALAVTETPAYKRKVWDQNPATSAAWTDAAVNAAEWGVEVA